MINLTIVEINQLLEKGFTPSQITQLLTESTGAQKSSSSKKKTDKAPQTSSKKKTAEVSEKSPKEIPIPRLTPDQLNNWSYYKKVRSNYCYAVLGAKVWKGKVTKPKGFVFDRAKWDAAKAAFMSVNPYIKVADR